MRGRRRFSGGVGRGGFSFLELQVSLALLGIALVGLVPLVVMQARQLRSLEYRWEPTWTSEGNLDYWIDSHREALGGPAYDLVAAQVAGCTDSSASLWARRLGAPARLVPRAATAGSVAGGCGGWPVDLELVNTVQMSGVGSVGSQSASATVTVQAIEEEPEEP